MGKERDGSDDRVDGGETVGNSLGRAPLGGSEMEATTRVDGGETVKIVWGERDALRSRAVGTGFQDKFHQCDCPEKLVPKTSQTVSKRWAKGHAGHAWEKVLCWRGFHFARRSVRRCLVFAPFAAKQTKREPKHRICISVNGQVGK